MNLWELLSSTGFGSSLLLAAALVSILTIARKHKP